MPIYLVYLKEISVQIDVLKINMFSLVVVAHTYGPSTLGGQGRRIT